MKDSVHSTVCMSVLQSNIVCGDTGAVYCTYSFAYCSDLKRELQRIIIINTDTKQHGSRA